MNNTIFVLVDVQERLANVIDQNEAIIRETHRLISGLKTLEIPILWLEQYPKGLGPTCEPLKSELTGYSEPIEKREFSGYLQPSFVEALEKSGRKRVIVAGMESHVCVYQTVKDLLKEGYRVEIVADCIGSRTAENRKVGIKKMMALGAQITSVETLLFELLETSLHPKFREISNLIK